MITKITDAQDTAKELFDLLNKFNMRPAEIACTSDLTRQELCWGELSKQLDKIPDMIQGLKEMAELASALASNLYVRESEQVTTADADENPELVEEYRALTQLGIDGTLTPAQADRRAYIIEELEW